MHGSDRHNVATKLSFFGGGGQGWVTSVAQPCPTFCNPMNYSPPGSSVMEFSRQEYWSGLPFPSPGDLPDPEIEPRSPALQAESLPTEPPGRPIVVSMYVGYIYDQKMFGGYSVLVWASQVALVVKNLPANAGDVRDVGSIPGLGRSPGKGHGNPLQYSCPENPMDREVW